MLWSLGGQPWIVLFRPARRSLRLSPKSDWLEWFRHVSPSLFKVPQRPRNTAFESIQRGLADTLSTLVTARMSE